VASPNGYSGNDARRDVMLTIEEHFDREPPASPGAMVER